MTTTIERALKANERAYGGSLVGGDTGPLNRSDHRARMVRFGPLEPDRVH